MLQKLPLAEQVVLRIGAFSGIWATVGQQLAQKFDHYRQWDKVVEKVAQNRQGARERGSWGDEAQGTDEEDEGDWPKINFLRQDKPLTQLMTHYRFTITNLWIC